MEICLLLFFLFYLAIGFLAALVGKGLLVERGLGTPEEREMMAWLILFLWPLYAVLYGAWRLVSGAATLLKPSRAVRAIALLLLLLGVSLVFLFRRSRKMKQGFRP